MEGSVPFVGLVSPLTANQIPKMARQCSNTDSIKNAVILKKENMEDWHSSVAECVLSMCRVLHRQTHIHGHTDGHIHTHGHTYTDTLNTCTHVHTHTETYTHIQTDTHTGTHTHSTHAHICAHTQRDIHTRTHTIKTNEQKKGPGNVLQGRETSGRGERET